MFHRRILIVEDDLNVGVLVSELFKERSFDVDLARTGQEAIEKINRHPDIILLDRNLPDMEGLDICRMIREDKRFRGVPIIIVSGRDTAEDKIQGLYVGADDYITKPFLPAELVARVDVMLRRVKFAEQLEEERESLIKELDKIMREDLITIFFQPIFMFRSRQPIGFEVLSRPPADSCLNNPEFLFKLALSCGKYFELEMYCWKKAFAQWKQSGRTEKLFLNCSPYLIECGDFNRSILQQAGIHPRSIVMELTERIAINDYGYFYNKLSEFRDMDIQIAVDDVGCGYASLNMVAEIKPHFLKIDASLVRSIEKDLLKQDIVEAVIQFSAKNRMTTIAEGVETEAELNQVQFLGVDAGQGYYLARPGASLETIGMADA